VEIKIARFDAYGSRRTEMVVEALNTWLRKHPNITRVSLCVYSNEDTYTIDFFYTEPEPESYREQGQPG